MDIVDLDVSEGTNTDANQNDDVIRERDHSSVHAASSLQKANGLKVINLCIWLPYHSYTFSYTFSYIIHMLFICHSYTFSYTIHGKLLENLTTLHKLLFATSELMNYV